MFQLIVGSFLLSLIHAAIPNHWLPLVLIGRSEGWKKQEALVIAGIAGFAHTLSTIGLGIIIGFIGVQLAEEYAVFTTVIAPLVLIFMGLIYVGTDLAHSHHQHFPTAKQLAKKSRLAIIVSISVTMFFPPCLEIEAFYLTAGNFGWLGITSISLIYLLITISGIVGLVALGNHGLQKLNWNLMEQHKKRSQGVL